jgi:hypothetical protein
LTKEAARPAASFFKWKSGSPLHELLTFDLERFNIWAIPQTTFGSEMLAPQLVSGKTSATGYGIASCVSGDDPLS